VSPSPVRPLPIRNPEATGDCHPSRQPDDPSHAVKKETRYRFNVSRPPITTAKSP